VRIPGRDLVFFVALLATALAMGAALAHLLALPNKIALPRDEYFIAQKAYRGWSQLAYLLAIQLASLLLVAATWRREAKVLWPTLAALLFLAGAQALFWIFTFPANVATQNWTVAPGDWERLRARWEYSHAAGALFQVLAMAALSMAVLRRPARGP
jgi:hypothetical protein